MGCENPACQLVTLQWSSCKIIFRRLQYVGTQSVHSGVALVRKTTDLLVRADHQAHAHVEHLLALRDGKKNVTAVASASTSTNTSVPIASTQVAKKSRGGRQKLLQSSKHQIDTLVIL